MEVIKKRVKRIMTTGTTSGCTSINNCYVIIPDTNAVYKFKILLTADAYDWGVFDAVVDDI